MNLKHLLLAIAVVLGFCGAAMLSAQAAHYELGKPFAGSCEGVLKSDGKGYFWLDVDADNPCHYPDVGHHATDKTITKVLKTCSIGQRCRITGVMNGLGYDVFFFVRVDEAKIPVMNFTPPKLDPFLSWSEMDNSYQGTGWINRDFIVGCHEVEGEGNSKETACTTSRTIEVLENPQGPVIAGLSKGMNVIVLERRSEWTKVYTACGESITPGGADDWHHSDAHLFTCPEKSR